MNTVEIIMQQKKIAEDKKQAERNLAYNTIKEWAEKNADKFARILLSRISKKCLDYNVDEVEYRCWCGSSNYPLGKDYPKEIGSQWRVRYYRNRCSVGDYYSVKFEDDFFENHPISKNEYNICVCRWFISQFVFHTTLPNLLRKEGFIVNHKGCGCSETINIKLPQ